ncbi:hypothetical protein [Kitasatospora sp. NPDC090308]|uniref:DUF7848 domain-containing protein n=1 Tax=Kitasatospora sp. NPDC090308 TaxID=3364082 RepID=UPI00381A947B
MSTGSGVLRFREFKVAHDDERSTVGSARCEGGPNGACAWTSSDVPLDMVALNKAMAQHTADTAHRSFLRTTGDHVLVTPGRWDGE